MTRRSTERGELRDAVEAFAEEIVAKLRDQILADMSSLLGAGAVPAARRPASTTKPRAEAERRAKARPRSAPRASVEAPVKVAARAKASARAKSSAPQADTRPVVARRTKADARPQPDVAAVAQPVREPDVVAIAPTSEAVVHQGTAGLGELDVLVGVPRRIVPPRAPVAAKRVEKPVVVAPEPFRPVPPFKRVRAPMVMLTADDFMSLPRDEEKVEAEGADADAEPATATGT